MPSSVWFSDLHYYQRLVISFAACLLQDSFFFFFLGIRKMDYGGASKQEEGEHACYTLILLHEVKNLVSLCEILGCSAILNAASFFCLEIFLAVMMHPPPYCKLVCGDSLASSFVCIGREHKAALGTGCLLLLLLLLL
jgi:hypothetical protein